MGKKRAGKQKAVEPACDHEPVEVSKGGNGSTFWACACGEKQWVSGPDSGGKLLELEGKQRLNVDGPQGKGRVATMRVIDDPLPEKKAPNVVQHSSETNEHYTPEHIVKPARELMGGRIALDPASCPQANSVVQALRIFTQQEDGLRRDWFGNVFLNPPGGALRLGKTPVSHSAVWWCKLVQEWEAGRVEQAVFIGFTLEILRSTQVGQRVPVQWFHRCYPRERIKFLDEQGQSQDQPGHANVIAYLPPIPRNISRLDPGVWMSTFRRFEECFGHLGFCEPGWHRAGA